MLGCMKGVSVDLVRSQLDYDPDSGELRWRERPVTRPHDVTWNKRFAGKVAGCPTGHGYLRVYIDGRHHYAHRLAWCHHHGEWPETGIDHINGNGSDNRIANLRLADQLKNLKNAKLSTANSSGIKGVGWFRPIGKWRARIRHNGREVSLGYYDDKREAERVVRAARERLHGAFANHGSHEPREADCG